MHRSRRDGCEIFPVAFFRVRGVRCNVSILISTDDYHRSVPASSSRGVRRCCEKSGVLILMRVQIFLAACLSLSAAYAAVVVEVGAQHFTLPDGFTIELAAGSTLVPRPMSASFDDHGRLYVTDSSGSNVPAAEQLKDPRSRVLRLEDSHGDGRYDKAVVFADNVMFPSGCLWHEGWVYVAAPPSIWRFRDRDGDGVADEREEWFKGGTLTSCGDDVHGPYAGPDGYIYWTKGEREEQKHERPGKKPIFDAASHVYRARTDGSDLDVIVSGEWIIRSKSRLARKAKPSSRAHLLI